MADLKEPFELCRILQNGSLCGIKRHAQDDNVILTFRDRGVLVYNLQHHKLINNWSVEQKDEVICAAVQNPSVEKFFIAVNNTEVFTWKESDSDLKNCQRIQSEKPIFGFHVWNSLQCDTLVMFEDGSSSFYEDLLDEIERRKVKKRKTTKAAQNFRLFWSGVFQYQQQHYVASIKIHKDHKFSVTVSSLELSHERNSKSKTTDSELIPPAEDAELLTCCIHEEGHAITSYWSDGSLCITELETILQPNTITTTNGLTCQRIHRLRPFHSRSKTKRRSVAMAAIDTTHICLCGSCSIDGQSKDVITIWNTKYGTLQSWQTLDKVKDKSSVPSPPLSHGADHACCTPSFLCSGFHQFVAASQFSTDKCSLASALGQLDCTSRFLIDEPLKPELLVTPKLAAPQEVLTKWSDLIKKEDQREKEVLQKLTDQTKDATLETFSAELKSYMESRLSKQGDKTTASKDHKKPEVLSQHFITSVLSRCVNEKRFWAGECISDLLKTMCVPSSSSKELLQCLVERSELGLIMECFENIKGIPEEAVVLCLRHFLRLDDNVQAKDSSTEMEVSHTKDGGIAQMPVSTMTAKYICTILSYPVNDVFLQDSLKKLTFKEVLIFMRFLVFLMRRGPTGFDKEGWSTLKYPQVLDWAGLLLNAHYTQLVLMPEAHELLVSCHRTVNQQVRCYDKLRNLQGFLKHYKKHKPLPKVAKTGLYSVEMVEI